MRTDKKNVRVAQKGARPSAQCPDHECNAVAGAVAGRLRCWAGDAPGTCASALFQRATDEQVSALLAFTAANRVTPGLEPTMVCATAGERLRHIVGQTLVPATAA